MAEAITYADLRFVKVPLKKSLSTWLGQDPEADEDGELTYENVQGPSAPPLPGPEDLAPCGPGEKAGVQSEQTPVAWSSVTSAAAWRVLPCCASHLHYVLLGLLLACALLAVAATCLGVYYLQVSRQLRQTDAVLGATNSSLRQQLGQQRAQLGRGEDELRAARRELAQSHEAERAAQALHLAAGEQLQACQAEREAAAGSLRAEEARRGLLEQRLGDVREQLKALLACSAETCCPVGWLPQRERCFYFSPTKKTWEESRKDCKSLSSDLASFKESPQLHYSAVSDSYWIGLRFDKTWQWVDGTPFADYRLSWYDGNCAAVQKNWRSTLQDIRCSNMLPYICEMPALRDSDRDHLGHF